MLSTFIYIKNVETKTNKGELPPWTPLFHSFSYFRTSNFEHPSSSVPFILIFPVKNFQTVCINKQSHSKVVSFSNKVQNLKKHWYKRDSYLDKSKRWSTWISDLETQYLARSLSKRKVLGSNPTAGKNFFICNSRFVFLTAWVSPMQMKPTMTYSELILCSLEKNMTAGALLCSHPQFI